MADKAIGLVAIQNASALAIWWCNYRACGPCKLEFIQPFLLLLTD